MVTRAPQDKAWAQLGTSGSGNHFVSSAGLEVLRQPSASARRVPRAAQPSGSPRLGRADGAALQQGGRASFGRGCRTSSAISPGWTSASEAGAEYWAGDGADGAYAAANHELIAPLRGPLGPPAPPVRLDIENHQLRVARASRAVRTAPSARSSCMRKGATPAGLGVLGIIPGRWRSRLRVRGRGRGIPPVGVPRGGRRMSRTRREAGVHVGRRQRASSRTAASTLLSAASTRCDGLQRTSDTVMAAQKRPGGNGRPIRSQAGPRWRRPERRRGLTPYLDVRAAGGFRYTDWRIFLVASSWTNATTRARP